MNENTTVAAEQPFLFPLADLKTKGYAKPEPREQAEDERPQPEQDAA